MAARQVSSDVPSHETTAAFRPTGTTDSPPELGSRRATAVRRVGKTGMGRDRLRQSEWEVSFTHSVIMAAPGGDGKSRPKKKRTLQKPWLLDLAPHRTVPPTCFGAVCEARTGRPARARSRRRGQLTLPGPAPTA